MNQAKEKGGLYQSLEILIDLPCYRSAIGMSKVSGSNTALAPENTQSEIPNWDSTNDEKRTSRSDG